MSICRCRFASGVPAASGRGLPPSGGGAAESAAASPAPVIGLALNIAARPAAVAAGVPVGGAPAAQAGAPIMLPA